MSFEFPAVAPLLFHTVVPTLSGAEAEPPPLPEPAEVPNNGDISIKYGQKYGNVGAAIINHHKPPIFDGWNPTHKNSEIWGMVYEIAIPTLLTLLHLLDPDILNEMLIPAFWLSGAAHPLQIY